MILAYPPPISEPEDSLIYLIKRHCGHASNNVFALVLSLDAIDLRS